jgi:hypothetical protein
MTTLTKLEKDLLENLLPIIDGSNEFAFIQLKPICKKLGWTKNTAKGLISSLLKKDIIWSTEEYEDGINKRPIFYFSMTVNDDDGRMCEDHPTQKEEINTVEKMEKYLEGVA